MIKLIGALLLVGYFLRCAGARRGRPAAADAAGAGDLHDARAAVADGVRRRRVRPEQDAALPAVRGVLVPRRAADPLAGADGHAAAGPRALLDGGGALRRRAADQGRCRPRERPDRRGQRLRVPAGLSAAVRGLPDVARPALADVVGDVLRRPDPRAARDALARRAGRPGRGRAVGGGDPAHAGRRCPGRPVRRRRRGAAGLHAVAAVDRRAPGGQEQGRDGERRVAQAVLAGGGVDGGRPPAAGRRAGSLRDRGPQLRPQRSLEPRRPGGAQRVPRGAGRGRRPDAAGVPDVRRWLVGADGAGAKTVRGGRGRRRPANHRPRSRRRSWWRSSRRTSCRCRRRCRCGCSAASRRCSRCRRRPLPRTREGRARHVDPPRGAARARRAARARPGRPGRGRARGGGRCELRGTVRRGGSAGGGAAAGAPVRPGGRGAGPPVPGGCGRDPHPRPAKWPVGARRRRRRRRRSASTPCTGSPSRFSPTRRRP